MNSSIEIPKEVFGLALESNRFFEALSGDSAEMHVRDALDVERGIKHAQMLQRFTELKGARVLEVGCGFGVNLGTWIKDYGADAYGLEPSAPEWGRSFEGAQILLKANNIDPTRVVNGVGESIPFEDDTFDVVYSANTMEHVRDPERVLWESVRVLKPGGILHFEVPNYMSFYETHYSVFKPPVSNRKMLEVWIRLCGKNVEFAKTINTITPMWCRRVVKRLQSVYALDLITLGEEVFLERLARPWIFEYEQAQTNTSLAVSMIQAVNRSNWIGHLLVAAQAFYPIFLTLRKGER